MLLRVHIEYIRGIEGVKRLQYFSGKTREHVLKVGILNVTWDSVVYLGTEVL